MRANVSPYRFGELRPGDYTVSISGFDTRDYEFATTSQDVSVGLDETVTVSFVGVPLRTSGIAGGVAIEDSGRGDVTVTLSGADDRTTATEASGQCSFGGLWAGHYTKPASRSRSLTLRVQSSTSRVG